MHFVEQLLGACRDVEPPAGPGSLRYLDASIGPHIGQRIAQAGQVIDLLLARIGEAAAGELAGAFEQVARQRAVGKFRVIVIRPTKGVQHRTEEQCRVGNASGDDQIGPGGKSLCHDVSAEVGIGRRHARQQRLQRRAVLHQWQFGVRAHDIGDLVTQHNGTGVIRAIPIGGMLADDPRRTHRVCRPHIGDDPDAAPQRRRHDRLHALQENRGVTLGRVLGPIERLAGDGALSQAFHGEIVEFAALDDFHAGWDAIISEPGAAANSDLVACHASPRSSPMISVRPADGPRSCSGRAR